MHSVTVTKKFYVCCFGEKRQWHLGGWPPRVSACWWVSPWAKGRPFWSLPVSVQEGGHPHQQLHGMLSTSTPPHLLFTEPGQLMNLHLVSAHHCLSLKSSAVPSKAVFIQGLAGSRWGLYTRGGQGNVLVLFFQPGSHCRDTQYEEREQKLWSCESQLRISSKLQWCWLLETGPSGNICTMESSSLYK